MGLDLSNSNKLDDSFSNFLNVEDDIQEGWGLPSGSELEDEFGGSALYPSVEDMASPNQLVEPIIWDAGNGNMYESTPYGYYFNFNHDEFSNFANDLYYSADGTLIDEDFANFVIQDIINFDGEEYSNFWSKITKAFSDAGKSISDAAKTVQKKVEKDVKDATKSIKDAATTVKEKGIGGALKDLDKEVKKLAKDAAQNIKGTIADATKSIKDAYESAKKWVGDNLGGGVAVHYLNMVNPVFLAMRGAVIGLMELNTVGLATAMKAVKDKNAKRYEEILQQWWLWGGSKKRYDEAVESAHKKEKKFLDLVKKLGGKGVDGNYYYSVNGQEFFYAEGSNPADIVITAASAIGGVAAALAAFPDPILSKSVAAWVGVGSLAIGSLGGILKKFAKDEGVPDQKINAIPQGEPLKNADVPTDEKQLVALREQIENEKKGISTTSFDQVPNVDDKGVVSMGTIPNVESGAGSGDMTTISRIADVNARLAADATKKKILGMSKPVFFTVLGVVVLAGGFLTYKLIKKK